MYVVYFLNICLLFLRLGNYDCTLQDNTLARSIYKEQHIKERHIKGGESTKRKYLKLKEG